MGFIRKVYGILTGQLLFTTIFSAGCYAMKDNHAFLGLMLNPAVVVLVLVLYIASICALVCCRMDKSVPLNYILLAVFTSCVSYIVGFTCLRYDPVTVVEAAGLTAAMTLAISIYAIRTKTDFTIFGPICYIVGLVFCVVGLFAALWGPSMRLAFCCIGVILFSFYLLMDTQMIIGGKNRRYQIDADSYILGAVTLYLDIINIFLYLLEILNRSG